MVQYCADGIRNIIPTLIKVLEKADHLLTMSRYG